MITTYWSNFFRYMHSFTRQLGIDPVIAFSCISRQVFTDTCLLTVWIKTLIHDTRINKWRLAFLRKGEMELLRGYDSA